MPMGTRLHSKVAVVTGAASGIGRATVEAFVAEGARVVAADIQHDAGAELARAWGDAVHFVACDVTQPAQIRAAVDEAVSRWGGLDILFNNAGAVGSMAGVENWDEAGWDFTQSLLLRSVAAGTAFAVPHLRARGGGSIINTSSVSALQAGYAPIAYSVAKAGVLHYTRLAAAELSAHRIRINALVPGFIATSIFGGVLGMNSEQSARLAEQVAAHSGAANPIGRSGLPADIAQAAVFLASDESGFVTGTHLVVDGGLTIGPRHCWDAQSPGPMQTALGITREQAMAMRARPAPAAASAGPDTPGDARTRGP